MCFFIAFFFFKTSRPTCGWTYRVPVYRFGGIPRVSWDNQSLPVRSWADCNDLNQNFISRISSRWPGEASIKTSADSPDLLSPPAQPGPARPNYQIFPSCWLQRIQKNVPCIFAFQRFPWFVRKNISNLKPFRFPAQSVWRTFWPERPRLNRKIN